MARPHKRKLAARLLEEHGRTFAAEAGIRLEDRPAPLFQLLTVAIFVDRALDADVATRAARALFDAGLTTPAAVRSSTCRMRIDVLDAQGYRRYEQRAAIILGDAADTIVATYDGDLRELRKVAGGDAERAKRLLNDVQGIGSVGADTFLREVQGVWQEFQPYADARVLAAAQRLHLGSDARDLQRLVAADDLSRLAAALVRVELADRYEPLTQGTH